MKAPTLHTSFFLALLLVWAGNAQTPTITSCSITNPPTGDITNQGYCIIEFSGISETRIYKDGHHFLSVLTTNGICALRPHPGADIDGWGSTLYFQPRFSGAEPKYALSVQCNVVTNAGVSSVEIVANGLVPSSDNLHVFGTWSNHLNAVYEATNKTVTASGTYNIDLPTTGNMYADLYFYQLSCNMMLDVPKNDGSIGDTGDASQIEYWGDGSVINPEGPQELWFPRDGSHWPTTRHDGQLTVCVWGNYNDVDTVRQHRGWKAIAPASKPDLKVRLARSGSIPIEMRFGVGYDSSVSDYFAADNVTVLPWVDRTNRLTNYSFNVTIESKAIVEDQYSPEFNITSQGPTGTHQGVYFSPNVNGTFQRVASLNDQTNGSFNGKVKVNTANGFFKVAKED